MPESEPAPGRALCDLFRDIGRSGSRFGDADVSEQRLMRLAPDPLLVHDLMRGDPSAEQSMPSAPSISGEAAIALAGCSQALGNTDDTRCQNRAKHYAKTESVRETSALPWVFKPSEQDRQMALDHGDGRLEGTAAKVRRTGVVQEMRMLAASMVLMLLKLVRR